MPTREVRRLVVADAIEEIHRRSRGVYGKRRVRPALLEEHEMIVNHKLVEAIMRERGMSGLPRPRRRKPSLLGVDARRTWYSGGSPPMARTNCGYRHHRASRPVDSIGRRNTGALD
jgi:helix-turn-helix protein